MFGDHTFPDIYGCMGVAADGSLLEKGSAPDGGVFPNIYIVNGSGIDDLGTAADFSGLAAFPIGIILDHRI